MIISFRKNYYISHIADTSCDIYHSAFSSRCVKFSLLLWGSCFWPKPISQDFIKNGRLSVIPNKVLFGWIPWHVFPLATRDYLSKPCFFEKEVVLNCVTKFLPRLDLCHSEGRGIWLLKTHKKVGSFDAPSVRTLTDGPNGRKIESENRDEEEV